MAELDILVPVYAGSEKLERCIASVIRNTTTPYNLIVSVQKRSVGENRNALLLMGRAPYVAFLDDDVEVPPGWDAQLLHALEHTTLEGPLDLAGFHIEAPKVGMVGPRIVGTDGGRQNASFDVKAGERQVQYVCGAVMLWKRETFPWLFADPMYAASQWEDTDITYQMLARGYVSVVDGDVTVVHHHAMTGATTETQQKNEAYFHKKWNGYLNAQSHLKEDGR